MACCATFTLALCTSIDTVQDKKSLLSECLKLARLDDHITCLMRHAMPQCDMIVLASQALGSRTV